MKKLQFQIEINAPCSKVYNSMLGIENKATYEKWTSEFNPSSTYEGSWGVGEKIIFLGTGENGQKQGMIAEIAENIPFRYVSIRMYGILDGDNEITEGEEVEKWAGGFENYTFEEFDGVTKVFVDTYTTDEYLDYFNDAWLKSLQKLKEMIEE